MHLALDQALERRDEWRIVVYSRHANQTLSAACAKVFGSLMTDFVDGFDAVGRETGLRDQKRLHTLTAELLDRFVELRFDPARTSKPRLECQFPLSFVPAQPIGNGLVIDDYCMYGSPRSTVVRDAVKAQNLQVGRMLSCLRTFDARGHRVDVPGSLK